MDDATIHRDREIGDVSTPESPLDVTDLSALTFIRTTYAAYDAGGGKPSAAHASRSVREKSSLHRATLRAYRDARRGPRLR